MTPARISSKVAVASAMAAASKTRKESWVPGGSAPLAAVEAAKVMPRGADAESMEVRKASGQVE